MVRPRSQPKHLSVDEHNVVQTHSLKKEGETPTPLTTWMNPENVFLSEIRGTRKILSTWVLKSSPDHKGQKVEYFRAGGEK